MPKLAGDTRISSCHTIIQQMLFSYRLLEHYFANAATGAEQRVFRDMPGTDWDFLEEMDAIVMPLATFCRGLSQSVSCTTPYYFLLWKCD